MADNMITSKVVRVHRNVLFQNVCITLRSWRHRDTNYTFTFARQLQQINNNRNTNDIKLQITLTEREHGNVTFLP